MVNFVFDDLVNLLIYFLYIFSLHIFRDEEAVGGSTSTLAYVDDIPHLRQVVNLMFNIVIEFFI